MRFASRGVVPLRPLPLSLLVAALVATGCASEAAADEDNGQASAIAARRTTPADPKATAITRAVLENLGTFDLESKTAFDRRVLLGQQDPDVSNRNAYGLDVVPSDMVSLVGQTPGLVGYDLGTVDRGATNMFDRAAFAAGRGKLRERIIDKRRRGILVSLVWHMRCPKASATEPDKYAPSECPSDYSMDELLERKADGRKGAHFDAWKGMLDELAELLWSLKDDDGQLIPVQIRPFHEFTGGWFWWGRNNDGATYAAVWRHMVTYLREGRGLHNALWVFCPAAPTERSLSGYEAFYPGDAFVDVVAFDRYDLGDGRFLRGYQDDLAEVSAFAKRHGKLAAVAEVGLDLNRRGPSSDPTWFTASMLAPLRTHSMAYVALWRNAPWEKFIPEPGDGAIAEDLKRVAASNEVLMGGRYNLYRPLHEH
jgi:mannan endo-1,4-beta-mannosidase